MEGYPGNALRKLLISREGVTRSAVFGRLQGLQQVRNGMGGMASMCTSMAARADARLVGRQVTCFCISRRKGSRMRESLGFFRRFSST